MTGQPQAMASPTALGKISLSEGWTTTSAAASAATSSSDSSKPVNTAGNRAERASVVELGLAAPVAADQVDQRHARGVQPAQGRDRDLVPLVPGELRRGEHHAGVAGDAVALAEGASFLRPRRVAVEIVAVGDEEVTGCVGATARGAASSWIQRD